MRTPRRFKKARPARAVGPAKRAGPSRAEVLLLGGTWSVLALIQLVRLDFRPVFRLSLMPWAPWLGQVLLIGLFVVGLGAYLGVRRLPRLQGRREQLFLVGLVLLAALIDLFLGPLSPYLLPLSLGVGLAVMFFGVETALVVNLALAGLGAAHMPEPGPALVLFAGALVMALRARRLERSRELILIGLEVGLVNLAALVALTLVRGWGEGIWSWQRFLVATLNGPIHALLLLGLVPLAEYVLQRTSPLGLIELLNTSHPLLERLAERAPGTYQHSLSVARLASAAARAIGADALLTQVGALYHDIGKASENVSPLYFAENQQDGQNPHDKLSPSMSRQVLVNHVKAGLEMGRAYGLKEDVLQFIAEHHGTTVMRFFYLKALKNPGQALALSDYRYDGPKPRSKETAILMLADAVESASRTCESVEEMEEAIAHIVQERLEDGQFDDCPLTLADLRRVRESFAETLRSMMHSRPRYPQGPGSQTRRGDAGRPRPASR